MEMKKINEDQYAFITKDGYDHPAVVMLEGEYKDVAWGYTTVSVPQIDELKDNAALKWEFEILDNAGREWEEFKNQSFVDLMGDILSDQIEEQLETGKLQFND
jgi:hypothetical protein|tara:strand:- start:1542 stop:1850 length:309 start_codon:yes stop_codon:yes gene_type:complete